MIKKNTLIDLYNGIGEIVCKYPYYEVEIMDMMWSSKIKPTLYIDTKKRKVYLKKEYI